MEIEQAIFYGITVVIAFGISILVNATRKEAITKLENEIVWLRSQFDKDSYIEEEIKDILVSVNNIQSRLYKLEETGEMK